MRKIKVFVFLSVIQNFYDRLYVLPGERIMRYSGLPCTGKFKSLKITITIIWKTMVFMTNIRNFQLDPAKMKEKCGIMMSN